MKFDELQLLITCSCVEGSVPDDSLGRRNYARRVRAMWPIDLPFSWTATEVCDIAVKLRKSSTTKLKAEIARAHGTGCFWLGRGKGPCSDEVEAGHVVAAAAGADLTVENGMIECRTHNNQRREMTIEEYLSSDKTTA